MDSLVSTEWLAGRLAGGEIRIVDVSMHLPSTGRDAGGEFVQNHIPGALFLDLPSLTDDSSEVPSALPIASQFAARMGKLGISRKDAVVLYDNSEIRSSARAWFMFRINGFENVAILDGGLGKWVSEDRPVEAGDLTESAEAASEPESTKHQVRTKADMLSNIESGAEQVLDARDSGRFTGETGDNVHNLPGGHIPGSRNLHFADLFNEDGTYREPGELRRTFERSGLDLRRPVVTACGSGVTASVLLFAMHLLGKDDTALYDGSWSEWGADPGTPKEHGQAK